MAVDANGNAIGGEPLSNRLKLLTSEIQNIRKTIKSDPTAFDGCAEDKNALIEAAGAVSAVSRGPVDVFMSNMATAANMTALRLFIRWKAFEFIPTKGSISFEELAGKLQAEPALIARIGGILVANTILAKDSSGYISHTATSAMLATVNPLTALVQMGFDDFISTLVTMPDYFDHYGLNEPDGQLDTVYAFACGDPKLTVFEHMARNPDRAANFMLSMSAVGASLTAAGSHDFGWAVDAAARADDRVLLVDIGAGRGEAVKAICEANPKFPVGRCVIEDVPQVIKDAKETDDPILCKAQFVAVDYHKGQPVQGALIYFIRRVLHDYGNSDAVAILRHIKSAMVADSRLLIVEQLMSNDPTPLEAATDMFLGCIGGKERTMHGFEKIVAAAGLAIDRVDLGNKDDVAVIVCKLAI